MISAMLDARRMEAYMRDVIRLAGLLGIGLLMVCTVNAESGWDPAWVHLEAWPSARQSDPNAKDVEQPAGAYQTSGWIGGDHLIAQYMMAAVGRLPVGRSIACCPGRLYPIRTRFDVVEYALNGNEIRLVIRHVPSDKPAVPWKTNATDVQLFVWAQLPDTLPKGEYRFVFTTVEDAEAGRHVTAGPVETRIVLPPPAIDTTDLTTLSNEQLLQEYVSRGEALKGKICQPADGHAVGMSPTDFMNPPYIRWDNTRREMRRRGAAIIPDLMRMLPTEVQRNPEGSVRYYEAAFGFARDLMEAMAEIGDPRPVPLLVEVLGGKWSSNHPLRRLALDCIERLTYVRFYDIDVLSGEGPLGRSLIQPDRMPHVDIWTCTDQQHLQYMADMAPRYQAWIAGEGHDASQWLNLARRRAHEILAGEDMKEMLHAITFLQQDQHDDAPDKTLQRLGQILGETKKVDRDYEWHGNKPMPVGNWVEFVSYYGAKARPLVPTILRIMGKRPGSVWDYRSLASIGGKEAMAYAVDHLDALASASKGVSETDKSNCEGLHALEAAQGCRWMIESHAGRIFDTDDEIRAWWKQNENRSPQQWLEDSLTMTAQRADAGHARAQALLRKLLPDLPNKQGDLDWLPPGYHRMGGPVRVPSTPPFREQWLRENRGRLVYDESRMCFRVRR